MNISKYTEGLGQEAKELPPNWRCFTEAEVERIVSLFAMEATRLTIEAVTFETEASLPVNFAKLPETK